MMRKIDFTKEPDFIIEEAIALHVLKWKWMQGRMHRRDFSYYKNYLTPTGAEKNSPPPLLRDYNQTIRLLNKFTWRSTKKSEPILGPELFFVVEIENYPEAGQTASGIHPSFLKAACFALLYSEENEAPFRY